MVSTVRSSVNQSLVELKPLGSELIVADGLCPQIAQLLSSAQQEVEGLRDCAAPLAAITEALAERRLQGQPV